MAKPPSKTGLRDELLARLTGELEGLEASLKAIIEGATHEQAKPENDKDTRALEQSYLARGQSVRLEALKTACAEIKLMPLPTFKEDQPIALGALVELVDDEHPRTVFLARQGGGTSLAKGKVQVVTPAAPLGRALLGKRSGDEFEVQLGGKTKSLSILKVH